MKIQYYLSASLFLLFAACVALRAMMLRKKGIRAIVFGETDKSDFILIPLILTVLYSIMANAFSLPKLKTLMGSFWSTSTPGWIGVGLCVIALAGMVCALISFGDSFRVGIDEVNPDSLITSGIFAFSRNPIYVSFIVFFYGQFLIQSNLFFLIAVICITLLVHRQILREEKFLSAHYGKEYENYCRNVRRYI